MTARRRVRVLYPHQLHESQLGAEQGTRFVLVEDDLLFRSQPFHAQKLVLHRAAGRHFVDRMREAGFDVDVVETDAARSSGERLAGHLAALRPDELQKAVGEAEGHHVKALKGALADAQMKLAEGNA